MIWKFLLIVGWVSVVATVEASYCICAVHSKDRWANLGLPLPSVGHLYAVNETLWNVHGANCTEVQDVSANLPLWNDYPVCNNLLACGVGFNDGSIRNFYRWYCDTPPSDGMGITVATDMIGKADIVTGDPTTQWPSNIVANATDALWASDRFPPGIWNNPASAYVGRAPTINAGVLGVEFQANNFFNTQGKVTPAVYTSVDPNTTVSFSSVWLYMNNTWNTGSIQRRMTMWTRWSNNQFNATCLSSLENCAIYSNFGYSTLTGTQEIYTFDTISGGVFVSPGNYIEWDKWNFLAVTFVAQTVSFYWNGQFLRSRSGQINQFAPNIQTGVYIQTRNFNLTQDSYWSEYSNGLGVLSNTSQLTLTSSPVDVLVLPNATLGSQMTTIQGYLQNYGSVLVGTGNLTTTRGYRSMGAAATMTMTARSSVVTFTGGQVLQTNTSTMTLLNVTGSAPGVFDERILLINASLTETTPASTVFALASSPVYIGIIPYTLQFDSAAKSWYLVGLTAPPVAVPPIAPPVAVPVAPPIATPTASPVSAPVSPPIAPPIAAPVAPTPPTQVTAVTWVLLGFVILMLPLVAITSIYAINRMCSEEDEPRRRQRRRSLRRRRQAARSTATFVVQRPLYGRRRSRGRKRIVEM